MSRQIDKHCFIQTAMFDNDETIIGNPTEKYSEWMENFWSMDEDVNGNNGLDYVDVEVQELGFDSMLAYYISKLKHKAPVSLNEYKENFVELADCITGNDDYYYDEEINFEVVEVESSKVLIAHFHYLTRW